VVAALNLRDLYRQFGAAEMTLERCRIDGYPLVHEEGEARRKCLNEQVTHHYHWPDSFKNSGWVLVPTEQSAEKK